MRVISGKFKGRQLKSVPGHITRPTTDKVKEAIFNRIGPYFDGGLGLDLYSGSGGLGIEALSRGLDRLIFIDRYKPAIEVINANLELCQLNGQAEVYRNDVRRALKALHHRNLKFDVIFMDPPYATKTLKSDIQSIITYHLLKNNGILVVEHDSEVKLDELWDGELKQLRQDTYNGNTAISIFERQAEKGL